MKRSILVTALLAITLAGCGDAGVATDAQATTVPDSTAPATEGTTTMADVPPTTQAPDGREDDTTSTTGSPPPTTDGAADTTQATTETTIELNPTETTKAPVSTGDTGGSVFPAGQIDPGLQPFVDMAVDDLAARLGVGRSDVAVVSATVVTWSDSSLGCPEPGMQYAQVLVDGSLIELGHGGRIYRYHSGGDRTPFLCDQPLVTPPVPGGGADT